MPGPTQCWRSAWVIAAAVTAACSSRAGLEGDTATGGSESGVLAQDEVAGGAGGTGASGSAQQGGTSSVQENQPPDTECPPYAPSVGAACLGALHCTYPGSSSTCTLPADVVAWCEAERWRVKYPMSCPGQQLPCDLEGVWRVLSHAHYSNLLVPQDYIITLSETGAYSIEPTVSQAFINWSLTPTDLGCSATASLSDSWVEPGHTCDTCGLVTLMLELELDFRQDAAAGTLTETLTQPSANVSVETTEVTATHRPLDSGSLGTGGQSATGGSGGVGQTGGSGGTQATGGAGGSGSCSAGLFSCAGICVDLLTDPANCGVCANTCNVGQSCQGGVCVCQDGLALCGTLCVDLQSDVFNCGGCGVVCPADQVCQAGACVPM